MYKLCLAVLVAFAMPSVAMAGGGSTKTKGSIQFINNSSFTVLVAVDPSDSLKAATTLAQFQARGGKVLNAGESHEFKNVAAGSHDVVGAIAGESISATSFIQKSTPVANGQKRVLRSSTFFGISSS